MTYPEELNIENNIPDLELSGGTHSTEIDAFVRESQKMLDRLIEDNKNLRDELKTEKTLRLQASQQIVERSASMLEEASEIAAKYVEQAKDQAEDITSEANAYADSTRSDADTYAEETRAEADAYRKSIVNEVETERDLIALEVEELHASHAETKAKIISFHKSLLEELEADSSNDTNDENDG